MTKSTQIKSLCAELNNLVKIAEDHRRRKDVRDHYPNEA